MKYLILLILLILLIACGSSEEEMKEPYPCEVTYSACEWDAHRKGQFIGYFAVRDCSWDYGVCISNQGEKDCEHWCSTITWIPSACTDGCY